MSHLPIKYTEEFPPIIGDRVYCPTRNDNLTRGVITEIFPDGRVNVQYSGYAIDYSSTFELDKIFFRYKRPWYAFFG